MRPTRVFIVCVLLASCGKHPVTPTSPSSRPLDQRLESASFSFRYAAGDSVDVTSQEAFHDWVIAALDVHPPRRVTYNKFFNRTHMGDITGNYNTNGVADPASFQFLTIWPFDNHETVHVYSALFGVQTALFNEGLAVAHQTHPARGDLTPRWSGTTPHEWARTFRRQGALIPLGSILTSSDFRRFNPDITYPESGSFVQHLLETFGLALMKQFFGLGEASDPAVTRTRFETVFGLTIEDAERQWWAMLDGR